MPHTSLLTGPDRRGAQWLHYVFGRSMSARTTSQDTPSYICTIFGTVSGIYRVESVVQMLLQQGGSPTSDDIEEASEAGHVNVVRLLLEHGVERLTPRALELATLMNHVEVVRLLLEYGARPMQSDLFNASYNGHWMILQLLLRIISGQRLY